MRIATLSLLLLAGLAAAACGKSTSVEGQGGTKLKLTAPASVTVTRGEMEKFDLKIARDNLPGDVAVRVSNLPAGVEITDGTQKIGGDAATYTLRASPTAALVENHVADVEAIGPDGVGVKQTMKVTVKEK